MRRRLHGASAAIDVGARGSLICEAARTATECSEIEAEINRLIDANKANGKSIVTTSWMPGADWTNTPFQPIYEKAARYSQAQAAQCFGLFVQEVFMNRPETWTSEHFEKDGKTLAGRT